MTDEPPSASVPEPLQVVSLKDATVYPPHPSSEPRKMHAGVLSEDGAFLEATGDDRRHGTHTYISPDPSRFGAVETIHRTAIYAGALHDAYGHFMLESLQRLWWAIDHPDLPIVWMAAEDAPVPTLNHWQRDMLEVVGIRNEVLILTQPARFDLLHVPDAGYKYADWSHPQQIRFLAAYQGPPQEPGTKLWLSRASETGVGLINRHIIERKLRDRGWTIMTCEQVPLRDQLDTLSRAEVVAGEEASTFHTLLLLRDVRGKRFHIFRRHGPEHISFTTIGKARQVDQQIHSCSHDAVISVAGRAVVRLSPNPAQYLSHLGIPIPPPRPLPSDWKPGPKIRRLNRLASIIEAESLLQIGWRNQAAITQLAVPARDIVDEEFRFDVRSYRDQGAHFYEVSLDEFLTWFAKGRTYDLVMLDGQHHWREALERVRRVFASATHERTVMVLTTALPVDEVAASSHRKTRLRLRRASGVDRKDRQGDVYKAVFAIHDLHPELDYRTIVTGGNSQTIIWRRHRQVRRRFSGEDEIATLDSPDVEKHRDVFAIVDEDEAMEEVRSWMSGLGRD